MRDTLREKAKIRVRLEPVKTARWAVLLSLCRHVAQSFTPIALCPHIGAVCDTQPPLSRPTMRAALLLLLTLSGCKKALIIVDPPIDPDTEADTTPSYCFDSPVPADRDRLVLVSHPFFSAGVNANTYEVLTLDTDGALSQTDTRFEMGRATSGAVRFSPDGHLGIAVQDDGTLGVFRVEEGAVQVLATHFGSGAFYAKDVRFDTEHKQLIVIDGNWARNGGGLYQVPIDCTTGELGQPTLWVPAKLAVTALLLPDDTAIVIANELGQSTTPDDVYRLDRSTGSTLDSVQTLDDRAIRSGVALVDGQWLFIADNSPFSQIPHRLSLSRVTDDRIVPVHTFAIEDPNDIAPSPFGNAMLVGSSIRNRMIHLRFDGEEWVNEGSVGRPRLPGNTVTITRGTLTGLVLVAETLGLHRFAFLPDGTVEDRGIFPLGTNDTDIVGSVGVQP